MGKVVQWASEFFKPVGSAKSTDYNPLLTPWSIDPLECADNGTRSMVYVKPVQAGGTGVGEATLLYWLSHWNRGDISYYWQNQEVADERWQKHFVRKIKACAPVMARMPLDRHQFTKCLISFPALNFVMQGVNADRSVASDSFRGVVCEELHDAASGWTPGRLEQVRGRLTQYWDSILFVISNASLTGDQLHQAFLAGTQQHWSVRCPGCNQFHVMRTRWEDSRPDLGGLRYDADGCRLPGGEYDYTKLSSTIFYQMPCGYRVHDNLAERRALSLSGAYGPPTNPGAPLTHRSYTLEGVSVHDVPFIDLIRQKHLALRALKRGDPEPWDVYKRERECIFSSLDDRPLTQTIHLNTAIRKNRAGLPNRVHRYATVDFQKGSLEKGELPHYWLFIQDWDAFGNSLVVFEGKILTEGDLVATIKEHEVKPYCVTIDSSWNPSPVYALCFKHGWSCIKVEGKDANGAAQKFGHPDGSRRVYSEPVPLFQMLGQPPSKQNPEEEPMFWHASKWGMMERLNYVRASKELKYEVPADVSEDFKLHFDAWETVTNRNARTNQVEPGWHQKRTDDHLYQCAAYACMMSEMDGLIGLAPESTACN